jgi:hypothetical protein
VIVLMVQPAVAMGAVLECAVARKVDSERIYSQEHLKNGRFSVLVEETSSGAKVSRCSFSSAEQRVTCDGYAVDRIEHDANIEAKKFYVFPSQFDVQIFRDLSFVENNGRGSISYGKCAAKKP